MKQNFTLRLIFYRRTLCILPRSALNSSCLSKNKDASIFQKLEKIREIRKASFWLYSDVDSEEFDIPEYGGQHRERRALANPPTTAAPRNDRPGMTSAQPAPLQHKHENWDSLIRVKFGRASNPASENRLVWLNRDLIIWFRNRSENWYPHLDYCKFDLHQWLSILNYSYSCELETNIYE